MIFLFNFTNRDNLNEKHFDYTYNQALLETGYENHSFQHKGSIKKFSPLETKYYEAKLLSTQKPVYNYLNVREKQLEKEIEIINNSLDNSRRCYSR